MKCVQCGVISAVEESLGRHLKAAHFATEMRDICGEVSIFVAFIGVALVNVPLSWAGEFIKVDLLIVLINDHNVWLFCSHTDLRRNGTIDLTIKRAFAIFATFQFKEYDSEFEFSPGMMCNRCNQVLYSAVESRIRAGGLRHKSTKGESCFVPNWACFTGIVSPFIFLSGFLCVFASVFLSV